jgi:hypothetical protein
VVDLAERRGGACGWEIFHQSPAMCAAGSLSWTMGHFRRVDEICTTNEREGGPIGWDLIHAYWTVLAWLGEAIKSFSIDELYDRRAIHSAFPPVFVFVADVRNEPIALWCLAQSLSTRKPIKPSETGQPRQELTPRHVT